MHQSKWAQNNFLVSYSNHDLNCALLTVHWSSGSIIQILTLFFANVGLFVYLWPQYPCPSHRYLSVIQQNKTCTILFLSQFFVFVKHKKRVPKNKEINSNAKRPLWEQRKVFGARMKNIWEEQLVYPLIHNITSIIAPWSLVLNKPIFNSFSISLIFKHFFHLFHFP